MVLIFDLYWDTIFTLDYFSTAGATVEIMPFLSEDCNLM